MQSEWLYYVNQKEQERTTDEDFPTLFYYYWLVIWTKLKPEQNKLAPEICSYVVHFKLKNGFFSLGCKPLWYDQRASKQCLNVRIGKIEKRSRMLFWQTLFELCFNTICITTADNFLQLSFPGFLPYSKVSNKLAFSLLKLQRAKKVVFHSPGLVDFAIGLVNSVFSLPDGLVMFFEESE